jgi:hypothetical protein
LPNTLTNKGIKDWKNELPNKLSAQQFLARYVAFYHSLLCSPGNEVAVISIIVGLKVMTNTGNKLLNMRIETQANVQTSPG